MLRVDVVVVHVWVFASCDIKLSFFFRSCFPGCMFDKVARHFYDDTCVVPEKVEGESCSDS